MEQKQRTQGGRNRIEFSWVERHRIPVFGPEPEFEPDMRIQSVYLAEGICNGEPFGAICFAPGNLIPRVEIHGRVKFNHSEARSVGLRLMIARDIAGIPHPEADTEQAAEQLIQRIAEEGRSRFCGDRIELDVPIADAERARQAGARWDSDANAWYAFSRLSDPDAIAEWLPHPARLTA